MPSRASQNPGLPEGSQGAGTPSAFCGFWWEQWKAGAGYGPAGVAAQTAGLAAAKAAREER